MTNSIRLIIPGKPMGKGRPRFYKGYVTPHVPTVNYENLVKTLCI